MVQLQTASLAVESPRATGNRHGAIGANITVFLEPDVNYARVAGCIVPGRGVRYQFNFVDIVARHTPQ